MKKYLIKLCTLAIGAGIFVGTPYFADDIQWICFSWIPAMLSMAYLDGTI